MMILRAKAKAKEETKNLWIVIGREMLKYQVRGERKCKQHEEPGN